MEVLGWNRDKLPVLLTGLAIFALIYLGYKLALPKPLPGIPYNKVAATRLFGDVRDIKQAKYRRRWIWSQPRQHGTPLSQIFLFPFRRPCVILTDYHEAADIVTRRQKEFDRGTRNKECVGFTAPNFHFTMESRDPRYTYHKALIRDLMTPRFLKEVSGPRIYESVETLVDLWDFKSRNAGGRPFAANRDLTLATLDIICNVAFSMEAEKFSLVQQLGHLQSLDHISSGNLDAPMEFPQGPVNFEVEALLDIPSIVAIGQSSPLPTLFQTLALLKPKHARAQWNRRALIRRQVDRSLDKLAVTGASGCQSALDQLLWREMEAAQKAGRKPDSYSPEIRDEILGYILAGHDSLATATAFWVKYMTRYQSVQDRLRSEMKQAHLLAIEEGRWPTKDEICTASIPYLDAVIEETLRYSTLATLIIRRALCDTQILGYPIPKGTDVLLSLTGPSVTEPALKISRPEELYPSDSKNASATVQPWGSDIHDFKPERWLKMATDASTGIVQEVFDAGAGPNIAFSAGPRQCGGKRLALMQMKIMMTILLWNFEFEPISEALNCDEVTEKLINVPKQCYAKVKRIKM